MYIYVKILISKQRNLKSQYLAKLKPINKTE